MSSVVDETNRARYYSGKKPYLVHNYRTMMKQKTQEEYYFHELHADPMSELYLPYLDRPDISGFNWEYMGPAPSWYYPPWVYLGGAVPDEGGGWGGSIPDEEEDEYPEHWGCIECVILGPDSVDCQDGVWHGFVLPSQCAGFIQFALGLDENTNFDIAGDPGGNIIVVIPEDTTETAMLVCNSGGIHGATCCKTVGISCAACCVGVESITLAGPATVAAGNDWVGTIDPACPGLNCNSVTITSNSGCTGLTCEINEAGSTLTISGTTGKCGRVDVSIDWAGCELTASDVFNITGAGAWVVWQSSTDQCKSGCGVCGGASCGCGCSITSRGACTSQPYKYGSGSDCSSSFTQQCKGCTTPPCGCTDGTPPPCTNNIDCSAEENADCGGAGSPNCPCVYNGYTICEWKCACA